MCYDLDLPNAYPEVGYLVHYLGSSSILERQGVTTLALRLHLAYSMWPSIAGSGIFLGHPAAQHIQRTYGCGICPDL